MTTTWDIRQSDVLERLREMPDESVHCVVTSPPYWGLRDYGVPDQLGLEDTPEEYVARMVEVFREVRRVLRSDGTLWLNLGDCYATGGGKVGSAPGGGVQGARWKDRGVMTSPNRMPIAGLKPKDLVGIPWRVAFALQSDGWWLRSDIIWAKPNPMPESVRDRPTKAHEYLFLLTKSARYFYDAVAIAEGLTGGAHGGSVESSIHGPKNAQRGGKESSGLGMTWPHSTRNKRTVWTITTKPYKAAHFATFPPELPEICIKAGTSEKGCCAECGAPWERVVQDTGEPDESAKGSYFDRGKSAGRDGGDRTQPGGRTKKQAVGWTTTCECFPPLHEHIPDPTPCTVLDPFAGSGTTLMVALRLGRDAIGIELNPGYVKLAEKRINDDAPLFNSRGTETSCSGENVEVSGTDSWRCKAPNKTGERCKNPVREVEDFCWRHTTAARGLR